MSLVITGNPGVGKHTIAKKISKLHEYDLVDINQIAFELGIIEKKRETADVDVVALKSSLKKIITKNSLVVGHLAPYVLTKSQIKKAVILRKSPYKLHSVYKKRGYSKKKISENLQSEILGITAYDTITKIGKSKIIQVDTTNKTIQQVVKHVDTAFTKKIKNDPVDWLQVLTEKNKLQKFFSY